VVDRQDSAQTYVAQIIPAPVRTSPDYFPFALADAIYGGGFNTRLNLNLREQKGYSYGVFTRTDLHSKGTLWRAMGGVQTDKTKESLAEFRSELTGLAGDKPITDKEMEDARVGRIRAYALRFESLNSIVGQVARLWGQGLPMKELEREPAEFQRMTLDAVKSVAKKYVAPSRTSTLLVGDWSKIGPGVQSLDLGEIVMLDAEGRIRK
jgi:zinc protease